MEKKKMKSITPLQMSPQFVITTWNVASLRAAWEKGFARIIEKLQPDIFCIQETKMNEDTKEGFSKFTVSGYYGWFFNARKAGYSGTAIYSKIQPISIKPSFSDNEGRSITAEFSQFYLVNTYVMNAGEGLKRLDQKMKVFLPKIEDMIFELDKKKPVIWTGDMNVARNKQDVFSEEEGHDKIAGYTNEERKWMESFLSKGFVDVFRVMHPNEPGYTFFSLRGKSRILQIGCRIDYFLISQRFFDTGCVDDCQVLTSSDISDHNPVTLYLKRKMILSSEDSSVKQSNVRTISTGSDLHSFFSSS